MDKKSRVYEPRTNAICVTVYHPQGEMIPAEVLAQCERAIEHIVERHSLLSSTATT